MTEGDEGGAGAIRGGGVGDHEERHRPQPQNIAASVPKPAREDIEEKFGKFEIKPLVGGDETFSLVSDTWSTDVLASDSETIEAVDRDIRDDRSDFHDQLLNRHLQELDRMQGTGNYRVAEAAGETFETASEAWSTDVLTSDSERLQEFDTDDSQSVARSDDAGRSELDEGAIAADRDLFLRPFDGLQPGSVNTPDNITPRAQQSRSPVDIVLGTAQQTVRAESASRSSKRNRSNHESCYSSADASSAAETSNQNCNILKPIPVLPASLSLDSASTCDHEGNLKTLPVMQINNGEGSPPSSAPPTIGFRPIDSLNTPHNIDLLGSNIDSSGSSLLSPDTRQSDRSSCNNTTSSSHVSGCDVAILTQNLQVLTLDPSSGGTGVSHKCPRSHQSSDVDLPGLKKPRLACGSSADESSVHQSTNSLASSTSSCSEPNGAARINLHISEPSGPDVMQLVR